jgi:uncharacterized protein (DUF486 family)
MGRVTVGVIQLLKADRFVSFPVLITDETLSIEEQQRMKVAFAEGYLAGSGQKTPGRTMKWLKIIQQLLTIVIFLAIFMSFMGKTLQWRYTKNGDITTYNY